MALKILSSKGTPERDILFVIEEPTLSREKLRLVDVENNLKAAEEFDSKNKTKIAELKKLKKDMKALLNKK